MKRKASGTEILRRDLEHTEDCLVVSSDVDGNGYDIVTANGNLEVKGSVKGVNTIVVTGNVFIDGDVEDVYRMHVKGDVVVYGMLDAKVVETTGRVYCVDSNIEVLNADDVVII